VYGSCLTCPGIVRRFQVRSPHETSYVVPALSCEEPARVVHAAALVSRGAVLVRAVYDGAWLRRNLALAGQW